jgi:predicted secreted protein
VAWALFFGIALFNFGVKNEKCCDIYITGSADRPERML